MKRFKNPVTLYYVSPTGKKTKWTTFWYLEDGVLFDEIGRAMTLKEARDIQRKPRRGLRLEGVLPEEVSNDG